MIFTVPGKQQYRIWGKMDPKNIHSVSPEVCDHQKEEQLYRQDITRGSTAAGANDSPVYYYDEGGNKVSLGGSGFDVEEDF